MKLVINKITSEEPRQCHVSSIFPCFTSNLLFQFPEIDMDCFKVTLSVAESFLTDIESEDNLYLYSEWTNNLLGLVNFKKVCVENVPKLLPLSNGTPPRMKLPSVASFFNSNTSAGSRRPHLGKLKSDDTGDDLAPKVSNGFVSIAVNLSEEIYSIIFFGR